LAFVDKLSVVRAALGSKSKQYRRIHQRASAAEAEEDEVTEPTNPT
jgi:hypothetical protein